MGVRACLQTPTGSLAGSGGAALALIALEGDTPGELDEMLASVTRGTPIAVGSWGVRELAGVDSGVVARWSENHAALMPHGSPIVVRRLMDALASSGVVIVAEAGRVRLPELATMTRGSEATIHERVIEALARAPSPLAVDLLLQQTRAWAEIGYDPSRLTPDDLARSRRLGRLIDMPLVAALGPPNIGKSTLLNTLAARSVSRTGNEVGTTRDYVGATLDLGGLVVRWMDAPGLTSEVFQQNPGARATPAASSADAADLRRAVAIEAQRLALGAAAGADLILLCADATSEFLPVEKLPRVPMVRVGLRSDLGSTPGAQVEVSATRSGASLSALVTRVRDALVPPADLASERPWLFW